MGLCVCVFVVCPFTHTLLSQGEGWGTRAYCCAGVSQSKEAPGGKSHVCRKSAVVFRFSRRATMTAWVVSEFRLGCEHAATRTLPQPTRLRNYAGDQAEMIMNMHARKGTANTANVRAILAPFGEVLGAMWAHLRV